MFFRVSQLHLYFIDFVPFAVPIMIMKYSTRCLLQCVCLLILFSLLCLLFSVFAMRTEDLFVLFDRVTVTPRSNSSTVFTQDMLGSLSDSSSLPDAILMDESMVTNSRFSYSGGTGHWYHMAEYIFPHLDIPELIHWHEAERGKGLEKKQQEDKTLYLIFQSRSSVEGLAPFVRFLLAAVLSRGAHRTIIFAWTDTTSVAKSSNRCTLSSNRGTSTSTRARSLYSISGVRKHHTSSYRQSSGRSNNNSSTGGYIGSSSGGGSSGSSSKGGSNSTSKDNGIQSTTLCDTTSTRLAHFLSPHLLITLIIYLLMALTFTISKQNLYHTPSPHHLRQRHHLRQQVACSLYCRFDSSARRTVHQELPPR